MADLSTAMRKHRQNLRGATFTQLLHHAQGHDHRTREPVQAESTSLVAGYRRQAIDIGTIRTAPPKNIHNYQVVKPWVLNRPTPNPPERIHRLEREQRNYSGCQNPNPTAKMAQNLAFFGPLTASGEWLDGW